MSNEIKENVLNLIADYRRINKELNEQLRINGVGFFEAFFQQLFQEHPGLNKVAILGWTPGFNDGEPCTHSTEVFTGVQRATWRNDGSVYNDYDDYNDICNFFTGEDCDEDNIGDNPNLDCPDLDEVKSKIENMDDVFRRVYDTNFIITVTRQPDGTVIVEDDDYECGY